MCVGTPLKIAAIDGIAGRAANGDHVEIIDLSLTPDAAVGDWVLTHLGAAREIITETEAEKIAAALDGLRAIMAGGSADGAFTDLENNAPQLPAHLQAALDAGQTTG